MYGAYHNCYNLTGSPVCGENVTNMDAAYYLCSNLTGSPVCGENVTSMSGAYYGCRNLTGSPICGNNVTHAGANFSAPAHSGGITTECRGAYQNCTSLGPNGYFYSNKIVSAIRCFSGRNVSNRLNLYVPMNSTTLNTCLWNNTSSLVGANITWTNDATNNHYYNTQYNIYIYPVENVEQARLENEFDNLINPSEGGKDIIIDNNVVSVKTEWIYPSTSLAIDTGVAATMGINLNELDGITIENVEVK
jgi:hypothetical protein